MGKKPRSGSGGEAGGGGEAGRTLRSCRRPQPVLGKYPRFPWKRPLNGFRLSGWTERLNPKLETLLCRTRNADWNDT